MPRLYKAADAFVLPSRGEGWGRPHVEAMSMALPVIGRRVPALFRLHPLTTLSPPCLVNNTATHWSGPSEFMTEANSYPLRHDSLEPVPSGPFKVRALSLDPISPFTLTLVCSPGPLDG